MITRHLILAAVTFFCFACASPAPMTGDEGEAGEHIGSDDGKTSDEMREEAWAQIDQEACAAKGGTVRQAGMLGMPRCIIPYADAGKICGDASDCEGKCLGSDDVTDYDGKPGTLTGRCEADDSPFGCYSEIVNGSAGPGLCVD